MDGVFGGRFDGGGIVGECEVWALATVFLPDRKFEDITALPLDPGWTVIGSRGSMVEMGMWPWTWLMS